MTTPAPPRLRRCLVLFISSVTMLALLFAAHPCEAKFCGSCGKNNKDANTFCTKCGTALDEAEETPNPVSIDGGQPAYPSGPEDGAQFWVPSWIVACEASKNADEVRKAVMRWRDRGIAADSLWIPDFASLSGKPYHLCYLGPVNFDDREGAKRLAAWARQFYREAYAIKLDTNPGRETLK